MAIDDDRHADDGLQLYLKAVGRTKLLSSRQERLVAERAAQGDPVAKRRLIEAHLPLVVGVAYRYRNRGLPLLDLIQEGTLGLHTAVEQFDPGRGARLSTYATWRIRSAIQRAIARNGRTVRLPADVLAKRGSIARAEASIMIAKQRMPTQADTAEIAATTGMTVEEVDWVRRHTEPEISLDAPLDGAEGWCLLDHIGDDPAKAPDARCMSMAALKIVRDALQHLSERERGVVDLRCGLTHDADQTLAQIGQTLGLTRERVRQIEAQALEKLQAVVRAHLGSDPFA